MAWVVIMPGVTDGVGGGGGVGLSWGGMVGPSHVVLGIVGAVVPPLMAVPRLARCLAGEGAGEWPA